MSLKDLLIDEKKVNNLRIKVLEIQENHIIVGDKTGLAICSTHDSNLKNLAKGSCYMILKPIKQDENTFVPNEKLKPIKIGEISVKANSKEIQKLVNLIKTKLPEKTGAITKALDNLNTFQEVLEIAKNGEIKTLTVKVISISKDIAGKYGTYNIAKIKDKSAEKLDINLYNKQVSKNFKRGDIIELRNLKLTGYIKAGENIQRLATTGRSSAHKCSPQIEEIFKNVPLGDEREQGIVLAVNDIFPYLSCSKCWKKTNENDDSCICGNTEDIKILDFYCEFYILLTKNNDVKVVHTFRRQTGIFPESDNLETLQKTLDNKFVDKSFIFDWNNNIDNEESMMVEITKHDENTG